VKILYACGFFAIRIRTRGGAVVAAAEVRARSAPLLALAGPSRSVVALPRPPPSGPGAHLSCPQRPTVLARALAVTGCRAAAHMGKKAKHGSPAGRGREGQGALPLSKITACMHTVRSTELSTEGTCEMGIMGVQSLDPYCTK
jgi:hypothetical protein